MFLLLLCLGLLLFLNLVRWGHLLSNVKLIQPVLKCWCKYTANLNGYSDLKLRYHNKLLCTKALFIEGKNNNNTCSQRSGFLYELGTKSSCKCHFNLSDLVMHVLQHSFMSGFPKLNDHGQNCWLTIFCMCSTIDNSSCMRIKSSYLT